MHSSQETASNLHVKMLNVSYHCTGTTWLENNKSSPCISEWEKNDLSNPKSHPGLLLNNIQQPRKK